MGNPNVYAVRLFMSQTNVLSGKIMNFLNNHEWAQENPLAIIEGRHQHT